MAAADVVAWLGEQAGLPDEHREERLQMELTLAMARSYLAEYAVHLERGLEPHAALMAAARGELRLTKSQRDLLEVVVPHVAD